MSGFNLVALHAQELRNKAPFTILHRSGGIWSGNEVNKLTNGLAARIQGKNNAPEYLVVFGHYTKAQALAALGGGLAFTSSQVVGYENENCRFAQLRSKEGV